MRHIERTALIVHIVDATGGFEGRDPVEDYHIINHELEAYAAELAARPQIVVANKCDMPNTAEAIGSSFGLLQRQTVDSSLQFPRLRVRD